MNSSWTLKTKAFITLGFIGLMAVSTPAEAFVTLFKQTVAEKASEDDVLAAFYRERQFAPIWMGEGAEKRRAAFLWALDSAPDHGLPISRYDPADIRAGFAAAETEEERAELEVRMTKMFLRYAADVSGGILNPKAIDSGLVLTKPNRDPLEQIKGFADADPFEYVKGLWPTSPMYTRLLREKLRLEDLRARGGWGPRVQAKSLEEGDNGSQVVVLRNRLVRMGYLRRSAVSGYDAGLAAAVRAFQVDHGLESDGQAGPSTLRAINTSIESRIEQVLVGLERQRWLNKPLGERHILVNIAEFRAYVVDDGKVSFETVVVTGKNTSDRRTPEFSDMMTHMVVNPTWHVPRSIAVRDYLPRLQNGGAQYLKLYRGGRQVSRANVDFSQYTASTFPFDLKQDPSPSNALGLVKFMFPNRWNIYLHDTNAKQLFSRNVRAFSSGCVRVERPFDLAYHLLAPQSDTPKALFDGILATGVERQLDLETPIPVHIVYWSTWVTPEGRLNYRLDHYERDRKVLSALKSAGVELRNLGS